MVCVGGGSTHRLRTQVPLEVLLTQPRDSLGPTKLVSRAQQQQQQHTQIELGAALRTVGGGAKSEQRQCEGARQD